MDLKDVEHLDSASLREGDALIVVDMQYDFLPGGALAVENGDAIIPGINSLIEKFHDAHLPIIQTQDWHTPDHSSFASAHEGKKPYDSYDAPGIGPVLWPDHCVQGEKGAEFHSDLQTTYTEAIIRKGYRSHIDSYSGFLENDHETETGLDGYLKSRGIERIFVCGLAMDYCVYFTAADGSEKGYDVFYLTDLTKPVGSPEDSVSNALKDMKEKGVNFLESDSIHSEEMEESMVI
ncbi:MAG: bifunctional nicotinamidase/pyrazinamidase [Candidatus Marinimicrobia bacterium]|nr:bifunctional nicotinamidase/pyrazinamidase [Candidatus Neomarinimicrobiota bacterium]